MQAQEQEQPVEAGTGGAAEPLLDVVDVVKKFPGVLALDGVSLQL